MNVWMRGRAAGASASPARSMSARQPRDDRPAHRLGDPADRFRVGLRGDRKARLDDVDPQRVELVRHPQLFLHREGVARRLLAVPERRVEHREPLHRPLLPPRAGAGPGPPDRGRAGYL